ncbi:MAG: hypothetical protein H8D23_05775 [Candidatus Brocadiales bacterium]|nr:hypothetical protein [Candidatus Brocadiales bacterium]
MGKHTLHEYIGNLIDKEISDLPEVEVIKDPACGGNQNIPLFCSKVKSNRTEYCNVDLLILKDKKVKVIVEIEEANIKPTQICGKFLTSALSSFFIHESGNNEPIGMDDSVLFVQFLDTSKLKIDKTSKIEQWANISKSIQDIIPVKNSKINSYKLFSGDVSTLDNSSFVSSINEYLNPN